MKETLSLKPYQIESEGEEYIFDYLYTKGFSKISPQKKVHDLIGDTKTFRKADFYLDYFDLYVEFFGLWNVSDKNREEYRKKKYIYEANGKACVYIYPENLGILDFIFKRRAIQALKLHCQTRELRRFRWMTFLELQIRQINFSLFLLLIIAFGFLFLNSPSEWIIGGLFSTYLLIKLYRLLQSWNYVFKVLGMSKEEIKNYYRDEEKTIV